MPDAASAPPGDPRSTWWVGDAEREEADLQLQRAVGIGVLDLSAYEERVRAVWCAKTRGDLAVLTQDLPEVRIPPERRRSAQGGAPAHRQRTAFRVASVLAVGTLSAGAVFSVASGGSQSTVAATTTAENADTSAASGKKIMLAPGQRTVDLAGVTQDVVLVVPDQAWVDVSALRGTGSVDCLQACEPRAAGDAVRVKGQRDDDLTIVYRSAS